MLRRIKKTRKGAICQSQYQFSPESIELPLMEIANPRQLSTHTNVNVFPVLLHLHIEWPPQLHERKCILYWNYTSNVGTWKPSWQILHGAKHFGWLILVLLQSIWPLWLEDHIWAVIPCDQWPVDGIHLHRNIAILHLSKGPYKLRHCACVDWWFVHALAS